MALSSTAATLYISGKNLQAPTPRTASIFLNSISLPRKQRRLTIRSSGDVSSETPTTETESKQSIEAPKGAASLISALNVERALRGIAITDVDHYGILGLQRGSSYEEVTVAYQSKVEELLKQGLDEEERGKKRDLLQVSVETQESYSILSSVEERRLYDWSLARSEQPDGYAWPFEEDITQIPTEEPPPPEPEDVGPTRLVGYFFLGWLILSFVLSIALAR